MLACDQGDVDAVRLLMGARADPYKRDKPYSRCWGQARWMKGGLSDDLLCRNAYPLSLMFYARRTCLHYAAIKGHAAVIQAVLELIPSNPALSAPW